MFLSNSILTHLPSLQVAGVITNFRMPDTKSIGIGGGSFVVQKNDDEDKKVWLKRYEHLIGGFWFWLQRLEIFFSNSSHFQNLVCFLFIIFSFLYCQGWYFKQNNVVDIENVSFTDCSLPIAIIDYLLAVLSHMSSLAFFNTKSLWF